MREPKTVKKNIDMSMPVLITGVKEDSCYGKEFDISQNECIMCADNLSCGVIFSETTLKVMEQKLEEAHGPFLDRADFDRVTEKAVRRFTKSGKTTIAELFAFCKELSAFKDDETVKICLRRFVTSNDWISVKGGIVWLT